MDAELMEELRLPPERLQEIRRLYRQMMTGPNEVEDLLDHIDVLEAELAELRGLPAPVLDRD